MYSDYCLNEIAKTFCLVFLLEFSTMMCIPLFLYDYTILHQSVLDALYYKAHHSQSTQ